MTRRDRMLLIGVIPVLVLGAFWFLALSPKRDEAQRLDDDIAAAHTRLATAQGQVAQYEAARKDLQENFAALAKAGRAVPANPGVPALLRDLEALGRRTGVRLVMVSTAARGDGVAAVPAATPAPVADGTAADAAPAAIAINLSLGGSYFAVQRYFAGLDRMVQASQRQVRVTGRLVTVKDVTVASKKGHLKAEVETVVHTLPGIGAAALPVAPDGAPATPPATPPAPSNGTLATAGVTP